MKKIIAIVVAFALIALDVWLYFRAEGDKGNFLLYFGLASAIGLPVAFELLKYVYDQKERETMSRLAKVPEIDNLIETAETWEQKYKILREEYSKLQSTIRLESEKQALIVTRGKLENDATRLFEELSIVDAELSMYDLQNQEKPVPAEALKRLQERVQAKRKGDIVLRLLDQQIIIRREDILDIRYFGIIIYLLLRALEELDNTIIAFSNRIKKT